MPWPPRCCDWVPGVSNGDWHELSASGPVTVLVHGLEDSWRSWVPLADLLAPRHRLIALDLPWRAGNDYAWHAGGTPGQWLDRALSAVPHPISSVVSHSFGAMATLELLSTRRTFDRAALLAPLYRPAGAPLDERLRSESRRALESAVRTGLRLKLGGRKIAPDVLATMQRKLVEHVMPRSFPPFFDSLVSTGDLPLSQVDTPTLVLSGTTDISLPPAAARALAEAMPAAQVRQHPGHTHFCHLEQTAAVAAELDEFLSHHGSTRVWT